MKFTIVCRHCGTTLMKTNDPVLAALDIEIKCPNQNCKKSLFLPEDIIVVKEKKVDTKKGLEART